MTHFASSDVPPWDPDRTTPDLPSEEPPAEPEPPFPDRDPEPDFVPEQPMEPPPEFGFAGV
jgi:hypothetical protein